MKYFVLFILILGFSLSAVGHEQSQKLQLNKPTTICKEPGGQVDVKVIKLTEPEGYLIINLSNAGVTQTFVRGWDKIGNPNRKIRHAKAREKNGVDIKKE